LEPSRLTRYVLDVAIKFPQLLQCLQGKRRGREFNVCKNDTCDSTRLVIKNVLDVLSITAPEKM